MPIRCYSRVGIKDLPVPKTDTQERESLDKAISFDQKCASMYSLQLSGHVTYEHKMADSGFSLYP
jgi:hypothetical protein